VLRGKINKNTTIYVALLEILPEVINEPYYK